MRIFLAVLAAALALAAAPHTAAAEETIATIARSAKVAALDGRLAWSAYDAPSDSYRLMTRVDGETTAVPVPSADGPFDVDLGPTRDGGMAAVYTRCVSQCDVHMYDFATGREQRLPGTTIQRDERLPSLWKDAIAFVRTYGDKDILYVRDFDSTRSERVTAGLRSVPDAVDLYGKRVASTWVAPSGEGREWELRLHTLGRGGVSVRRTASGALSAARMLEPTLDRGAIFGGIARSGSAGNRYFKFRIATGNLDEVISRRGIEHLAFDERFFYVLPTRPNETGEACDAQAPCLLRRSDPVAFGPS